MSKILLAGHTGSINRGCEAIVRSTVKLLKEEGIYDICMTSDNITDDKKVRLDTVCKIYPTQRVSKYSPRKIIAKVFKTYFKSYMLDEKLRQQKIFDEDDVVLMIGGDTYCYGRPIGYYAAHRLAKKQGAKTVLWACSLEKDLIDDEMLRDLNAYDLICPREQITYNTLIEKGISEDKIILVSDPAFNLDIVKTNYPKQLDENKTIGINISPIVEKNKNGNKAVRELIDYIINKTEFNIVLIPHVYKKNHVDAAVLNGIYEEYKHTGKVEVVGESLSCTQLKFIISKCRMFIGARTHSTIAAYSTCVPTLVIGYSVKSKGIASDLFGKYDNHVLMYDNLTGDELIGAFKYMADNENELREQLTENMPEYKSKTNQAVKAIKPMGTFNSKRVLYPDEKNCSGCGACAQACPKNCIKMVGDAEGFLYPELNEKDCIDCGVCENVCHYKNKPEEKKTDAVYGAINKNEEIRVNSSSGGVFHVLACEIIKRGGMVFGAGFDESFNVIHTAVEAEQDLYKLMGSKYVQSKIGTAYKQVKKALENDRYVLFTGTPCQINGLLSYLGNDYDKLITMDFICHGVPSPAVWRKYLDEMILKYGSQVTNVSFRSKEYGWKIFSIKLDFQNGISYIGKVTEDKYLRHFLTDVSLRRSCYQCNAKGIDRIADITVADFWGIGKIREDMNDDKGTSIIMLRGSKAENIMKDIKDSFVLIESDTDTVLKTNPSVVKSVSGNPLRNRFFRDVKKYSFDKTFEKYCGLKFSAKARRKLGKYMK